MSGGPAMASLLGYGEVKAVSNASILSPDHPSGFSQKVR